MLGTSHRSQRTPDPAAGESSAPAPRAHLAPGTMGGGDNTEWADTAANITHTGATTAKSKLVLSIETMSTDVIVRFMPPDRDRDVRKV